jgi:hypothetical protein
VCEAASSIIYHIGSLAAEETLVCRKVWGMRIISSVTILGGISLILSFLLRRVSQQAGAERVKERLHEQKDYHNLSSE